MNFNHLLNNNNILILIVVVVMEAVTQTNLCERSL